MTASTVDEPIYAGLVAELGDPLTTGQTDQTDTERDDT